MDHILGNYIQRWFFFCMNVNHIGGIMYNARACDITTCMGMQQINLSYVGLLPLCTFKIISKLTCLEKNNSLDLHAHFTLACGTYLLALPIAACNFSKALLSVCLSGTVLPASKSPSTSSTVFLMHAIAVVSQRLKGQ